MKFVATIVLLAAAALVFTITQPDSAPDMTMGLVFAFVTVGLVYGIAGREKDATEVPRATDSIRNAVAIGILVVGSIATFLSFSNPMLGGLFAVLVLGGGGYLAYEMLNRRSSAFPEQLDGAHLMSHDAGASPLQKIKQAWQLQFDEDLLEQKNRVMLQIEALTARHHRTRTFESEADAIIASNRGAARREVPLIIYGQYKMAELEGFAVHELKRFEMDLRLEEKQREMDMKFSTARDFATRKTAEADALVKSLAGFHHQLHEIKKSKEPKQVREAKLTDIVNTIHGLRQELNDRLGIGQDDAPVVGEDVRPRDAASES